MMDGDSEEPVLLLEYPVVRLFSEMIFENHTEFVKCLS